MSLGLSLLLLQACSRGGPQVQTVDMKTLTQQGDLFQFLQEVMNFSDSDLQSLKEGNVITTQLRTTVKHEMAFFSIVRIDVPKAFFVEQYTERNTLEAQAVTAWGRFSSPPEISDVQALSLLDKDRQDAVRCQVGDCKVKLSADDMAAFRQLDPSTPDFDEQVDALFRQSLVTRLQQYQQEGNVALVEYHDKTTPVKLAEEFYGLLEQSPYLYTSYPELEDYLKAYPHTTLANSRESFLWSNISLGDRVDRPLILMSHLVAYQPEDSHEIVIANKQLYANHFYEASLGLTLLDDDPEQENRFYLLHLNRARLDLLRSVPGFLANRLYTEVEDLLHNRMQSLKSRLETLYREG